MKVAVSASINCAHQLVGTEMHGHTYRITAIQSGDPDETGMVIPLQVLSERLHQVLIGVNHIQLEDVIGAPATAERLAEYIKEQMALGIQIRVQIGDEGYVETE